MRIDEAGGWRTDLRCMAAFSSSKRGCAYGFAPISVQVVLSVNIGWPSSIATVIAKTAAILDFDVDVINVGCLAYSSWEVDFFVQMLFPIVYTLSCIVVFGVRLAFKRFRGKTITTQKLLLYKNVLIRRALTFLSNVYLTLSRYATSVFWCTEVEPNYSVLVVYPGLTCGAQPLRQHTTCTIEFRIV
jgi:hypothetical protein